MINNHNKFNKDWPFYGSYISYVYKLDNNVVFIHKVERLNAYEYIHTFGGMLTYLHQVQYC